MSRPNWLNSLRDRFANRPTRPIRGVSRLGVESLEDRTVPATLSVGDLTIDEATNLGVFVPGNTSILTNSADLEFGPDRNGDSVADLYVVGRVSDNIVVYDGQTGAFVEQFLAGNGLDGAAWLVFGPDGDLFTSTVTQTGNRDAVLRVDQAKTVSTFISNNPAENGGLLNAKGMAFGPDGNFYVADVNTDRVLRYNGTTGAFLNEFVAAGDGLDSPGNILFGPDRNSDSVGDLYVASNLTDEVLVYNGIDGAPLGAFIAAGSGGLDGPHDMAFGPDGNLYVVSSAGSEESVSRFDGTDGSFIDVVVPSVPPETTFIAFNDRGNLYLSSEYAHEILSHSAGPIVTLSVASTSTVTVDFTTEDGTATGGIDYGALSGRLTFAPGETTKRILVSAVDDGTIESSETFTVNLINPVGATLADALGVITILDGDIRVNTTTAGTQVMLGEHHKVAGDATGNFVVVWQGNGPGDPDGVFFQRYDASGASLGSETRANIVTNTSQYNPVVGRASSNGKFIVAWNSDPYSVYGRIYNSNGTAATGEITIAGGSSSSRNFVESIAVDADGDFVILYRQIQTKGFNSTHYWQVQRFNAAGAAQGSSVRVASSIPSNGQGRLASDANGNFVVSWTDAGIHAQRFTNAGKKLGSEILVSATGVEATVARDADGDFIVGWENKAQIYNNDGSKRGGVITFSDPLAEGEIAMQANGNFVRTWPMASGATGLDIYAQRFDLNGVAMEAAHRVNSGTTGDQNHSSVAVANNGNYVAVWNSIPEGDVRGRLFTVASPLMAERVGANAGGLIADSKQVAPILSEALRQWYRVGADMSALANIQIQIADLGGTTLGLASGNTIWLDDNAAGWGWFLDSTPWEDSEFLTPGDQGEQGRMDLLSVLSHELGHLLGHDHAEDGVMAETLAPGVRTLDVSPAALAASTPQVGGSWFLAPIWLEDDATPAAGNRKLR